MAIITVDNLKAHLGIMTSDSTDDTTLGFATDAANRAVVNWCGRDFATTTTASASARVYRPKSPTLTITDDFWTTDSLTVKVSSGDEPTYPTELTLDTDFFVEPLNGLEDGMSVPYRRLVSPTWQFPIWFQFPPVQVTAAWGWAEVPDPVFNATLIYAARLFKRKNSPEGVLGGWMDYGPVRISSRQDPDVAMLLCDYRRAETQLYV